MPCKAKQHILSKVWNVTTQMSKLATQEQLAGYLTVEKSKQKEKITWQLNQPLKFFKENDKEVESVQFYLPQKTLELMKVGNQTVEDGLKNSIVFSVPRNNFIQDVLDSNPIKLNFKPSNRKVIVEYSSPNIAKPFHVGHLRSTIIGNFVANLKDKLGKNVTRINFLGDWGTQFGLLYLGVKMGNYSEEALRANPTKLLFESYVTANAKADEDPDLHTKAREVFQQLEDGCPECTNAWQMFRDLSQNELRKTYSRLGVDFDEYHWESSYGKTQVKSVLEGLANQGLLDKDEKGRTVAAVHGKAVPLLKSDDSTLYLLRDVAAAAHRRTAHDFDEMYYVVENGQTEHLQNLFALCKDIGLDKAWNLRHIKFGRVHGMSTRRGNVVFLEDILNEARDMVMEKQRQTATTKVEVTEEVADVLGTTAVIINDLKQRRQRDYEFSWDKALQMTGDTGVRLQYTHCRLHSLLCNSGAVAAKECDPEGLPEPEVTNLVMEMARFEEVLLRANEDLEACVLVSYLFHLTHAINKAFKVLQVKNTNSHVASQRLLLFNQSRLVLAEGLRLLGITPLNQM